jgi:glycosidase
VLWHGERRTLTVDDETGVYVYARSSRQEEVVVALNLSDHHQRFEAGGHRLALEPWTGDVGVK